MVRQKKLLIRGLMQLLTQTVVSLLLQLLRLETLALR